VYDGWHCGRFSLVRGTALQDGLLPTLVVTLGGQTGRFIERSLALEHSAPHWSERYASG